ncbi:MAG: transglutaminase-like domain-containing protein [Spirochaetes bacterium]|nr:transglutaminase-like domain-containing protein [Spirochaetota bacterium]
MKWPVFRTATAYIALTLYYGISPLIAQDSFYFVRPHEISTTAYSEKRSIYEIQSDDENFTLPSTPFQKVRSITKLSRGVKIILETGGFEIKERNNLQRFLANTRLLEISSEEIKRVARKFSNTPTKIQSVLNFVYHYISNKTLGIPVVGARTVLKTKTGDCTEHAVLTVAILRALGIPSKAMVGIILSENFGEHRNVFVFHMWAEAFDGGKWVLADATRPHAIYPNRYIAFAEHNLRSEMPLEYLAAISSIKNLSIRHIPQR